MCKAAGKSAVGSREIELNGRPHNHERDADETKVIGTLIAYYLSVRC